jgi:hypothetical protein
MLFVASLFSRIADHRFLSDRYTGALVATQSWVDGL